MRNCSLPTTLSSPLIALIAVPAAATASPCRQLDLPPAGVAVSYADLNASTAEGAAELLDRVNRAARRVCAASRYPSRVDRRALYDACVRDSTRDALERAHASRVAGAFVVQVRPAAALGSP